MRFADRTDAGKRLAEALERFRGQDGIVYALPRGGVAVGAEVATALRMPLDLIIPRKIGHPFNAEYAICAIAEDGSRVCNEEEVSRVDPTWLEEEIASELKEAKRRRQRYLGGREPLAAQGKIAIVVDDGVATGLTMLAAVRDARKRLPARLVVAVPVTPSDTAQRLRAEADELVALDIPSVFLGAIGAYYDSFVQVTDEEVAALLAPWVQG
jgi:putative phosphoribosyl transferase